MFQWFKNRKQLQAMKASAEVFIRFQFTINSEEPANHTDDAWALGYVFGAVTGLLQVIGIEPGEEAKPVLQHGFDTVYGSAGGRALQLAFSRSHEPDFAEAQLIGGSEMIAFGPGKPAPFGLGTYLGSGKGMGQESQSDVRVRLRERAMERMTPDAFRQALSAMTA
jgi:hypothetical protein